MRPGCGDAAELLLAVSDVEERTDGRIQAVALSELLACRTEIPSVRRGAALTKQRFSGGGIALGDGRACAGAEAEPRRAHTVRERAGTLPQARGHRETQRGISAAGRRGCPWTPALAWRWRVAEPLAWRWRVAEPLAWRWRVAEPLAWPWWAVWR